MFFETSLGMLSRVWTEKTTVSIGAVSVAQQAAELATKPNHLSAILGSPMKEGESHLQQLVPRPPSIRHALMHTHNK